MISGTRRTIVDVEISTLVIEGNCHSGCFFRFRSYVDRIIWHWYPTHLDIVNQNEAIKLAIKYLHIFLNNLDFWPNFFLRLKLRDDWELDNFCQCLMAEYKLKTNGDSTRPCRTPWRIRISSHRTPPTCTLARWLHTHSLFFLHQFFKFSYYFCFHSVLNSIFTFHISTSTTHRIWIYKNQSA